VDHKKQQSYKKIIAEGSLLKNERETTFLKSKYAFDVDSFMSSLAKFNEHLSDAQLGAFHFVSFTVSQCVDFINAKIKLELSLSLIKSAKQFLTYIIIVLFEVNIIQVLNDKRFD
jgi:hypothetical protein